MPLTATDPAGPPVDAATVTWDRLLAGLHMIGVDVTRPETIKSVHIAESQVQVVRYRPLGHGDLVGDSSTIVVGDPQPPATPLPE